MKLTIRHDEDLKKKNKVNCVIVKFSCQKKNDN